MTNSWHGDEPGKIKQPNEADFSITPFADILRQQNDPQPAWMQWHQPMEALLGDAPYNDGPTQDWEFQLVDLQARGMLDKPAYKNLTDETVLKAQNAVAAKQEFGSANAHAKRHQRNLQSLYRSTQKRMPDEQKEALRQQEQHDLTPLPNEGIPTPHARPDPATVPQRPMNGVERLEEIKRQHDPNYQQPVPDAPMPTPKPIVSHVQRRREQREGITQNLPSSIADAIRPLNQVGEIADSLAKPIERKAEAELQRRRDQQRMEDDAKKFKGPAHESPQTRNASPALANGAVNAIKNGQSIEPGFFARVADWSGLSDEAVDNIAGGTRQVAKATKVLGVAYAVAEVLESDNKLKEAMKQAGSFAGGSVAGALAVGALGITAGAGLGTLALGAGALLAAGYVGSEVGDWIAERLYEEGEDVVEAFSGDQ